jgi:soluble lytic murein transglycosylase-like protein
MPSTAAGLGVNDSYDPVQNIYGSVRYVKGMLDRMSGNKKWNELTWYDLSLALAAYNAGPGAVKKHGGVPPYKETQNYVRRVTSIYKQLCGVK